MTKINPHLVKYTPLAHQDNTFIKNTCTIYEINPHEIGVFLGADETDYFACYQRGSNFINGKNRSEADFQQFMKVIEAIRSGE